MIPKTMLVLALAIFATLSMAADAPKTLTVICYHRFGVETEKDPYKISTERLAGQLDWFKAQGYQSVSLKQLRQAAETGFQALPSKGLMLSVDDGYKAGLLGAAEFEKRGFRGVFFVNPGVLGHGNFMTWQACRDLETQGHEVASHTLSHPNLAKPEANDNPQQYKAWVTKELGESRRLLEKELNHPVTALAYPFGAYNTAVTVAAEKAGYTFHFTVSDGINLVEGMDPFRIRRILIMGHPSQAKFEKRMQILPVDTKFKGMSEGALIFKNAVAVPLFASEPGIKMTIDEKTVETVPGDLKLGFHFLTLSQGTRQTKLLFQIARDEWAPHFRALTEN